MSRGWGQFWPSRWGQIRPSNPVWDPAHRAAAEAAALGRTRAPLRLVGGPRTPRPARPLADYDVEAPDLAARYGEAR